MTSTAKKSKFESLPTTKLGRAGEALAEKHFTAKGFHCYTPPKKKRHPFDMVLVSPELQVILIEVKTYPKRWGYNDTGVDSADWQTYTRLYFTNANPLWLVFVDVQQKAMYYFEMNLQLIDAAREAHGKVFFPLSMAKMLIREIGELSLAKLRAAGV